MIKTLAKSIRNYKRASIITPITVSIEVILEVLIPFVMADLINYMEKTNPMKITTVVIYGAILIGMASISLVMGILSGKYCATASAGFAKNLRQDMFYKIQGFSFANIDKFSTSSLVTRMTTDVTNVQMSYMMIIRIAVRTPLMLVFSLIMSFFVNVYLALIFLVAIPIVGLTLALIGLKVRPIFIKVFKKYDKLNESVQENVRGARVVKAYVREDYEQKKFVAASDDIKDDFTRAEKLLAICSPVMQFSIYIIMILVAVLGGIITVKSLGGIDGTYWFGSMDTGKLMNLISYAFMILQSLMMLAIVLVIISMSVTSGNRIAEVLNEQSSLHNPDNAITEVKDGSISFNDVSFSYKDESGKYCLTDIRLHIPSGSTIGILGGTGSSKTTLVQLIPRLYDASKGSVEVGGIDVRKYDLDALRNSVAMVLQKNTLFSGTITENMRWGNPDATLEEIKDACVQAQAAPFIESFPDGYDTYIEQGGTNVSGGQKQRLCIARALLKNPKIIIFDDSTSAVDTKTDAQIRKALTDNIPGTTKIIIAQRVSSVQDADKIIVMQGGGIAEMGSHAELMSKGGIYKEIYDAQINGKEDDVNE